MQTVLMLTDFSENANHAAKSAAKIVPKLSADILLYHTYYNHPILTSFATGPWVVEDFMLRKNESIEQLSYLANQLKHILAGISPNGFETKAAYQCGEGPLEENTAMIIRENDIELVVIGSRTNRPLNRLIFGSDSMAVIRHASCPVLIVPPKVEMNMLKKVTFATDFELADINAINYLIGFSKKLGLPLEVVHVSVSSEKDDPVKEATILTHINGLKQAGATYQDIRGKDVVKRLHRFCNTEGPAILAMAHYHVDWLSNLFNRSATDAALDNPSVPLLVIPSEMVYVSGESTSDLI
jgi:nucleotide-binding universal stress UspA family protein